MEILKGRGVHDYAILRAWGGGVTHFGISEGNGGGGGVKTWKPSVVGYGYFLELPNFKCTRGLSSEFSSLYIVKREPTVEKMDKI